MIFTSFLFLPDISMHLYRFYFELVAVQSITLQISSTSQMRAQPSKNHICIWKDCIKNERSSHKQWWSYHYILLFFHFYCNRALKYIYFYLFIIYLKLNFLLRFWTFLLTYIKLIRKIVCNLHIFFFF
jgi:hypothetical protein